MGEDDDVRAVCVNEAVFRPAAMPGFSDAADQDPVAWQDRGIIPFADVIKRNPACHVQDDEGVSSPNRSRKGGCLEPERNAHGSFPRDGPGKFDGGGDDVIGLGGNIPAEHQSQNQLYELHGAYSTINCAVSYAPQMGMYAVCASFAILFHVSAN